MRRIPSSVLLTVTITLVVAAGASARRRNQWIALFNGKDINGWHLREATGRNGWAVENGMLVNTPPSTDLVSNQQFRDFDLHYEYMIPARSNSGVYLRGRYEIQIDDAAGQAPESHRNGAIYGVITPASNPSKPAGEWQTVDARILGNKVTVVLNGKKIIDNAALRVTGGALDDREADPGPIMLQGDHGKVTFRNVRIRPYGNPFAYTQQR